MRIALLVDEDPRVALLGEELVALGDQVLLLPGQPEDTGPGGMHGLTRFHPDVFVIRFPEDGTVSTVVADVLQVASFGRRPVIALTTRPDVRRLGIPAGVHAVLFPPFRARGLQSLARSLVLAEHGDSSPSELRCGDLVLDLAAHEARVAGVPVALTYAEFSLLAHLVRMRGRVVTRAELDHCFLHERGSKQRVDVMIVRLRHKLAAVTGIRLVTVRYVGYRCDELVDGRLSMAALPPRLPSLDRSASATSGRRTG